IRPSTFTEARPVGGAVVEVFQAALPRWLQVRARALRRREGHDDPRRARRPAGPARRRARQGRSAGPALAGRPAPLGAGTDAAAAGDSAALPLGRAAPDPVVDVVGQGVLEAGGLHRAVPADLTGDLDADTVAGEEH